MERSSFVKSDEIEKQIRDTLGNCLSETDLQLGVKRQVSNRPSAFLPPARLECSLPASFVTRRVSRSLLGIY